MGEVKMKKRFFTCISFALVFGFVFGGVTDVFSQEAETEDKLKFLVIVEPKDLYFSMPESDRKKIDDAATENKNKALADGSFLKLYAIPGWNRYVAIEQYDTIEDLFRHFEEHPYYPYADFEVFPLQEIDEVEKAAPDPKKMKFLVLNEAKDIWYTLMAEERKKIEDESPFNPGDLLGLYSIPGWNRTAAIEQYDSIESLYKHFEEDSYYPYANFEVYPLLEMDLTE
jgi:muconolactone delta-isomerase